MKKKIRSIANEVINLEINALKKLKSSLNSSLDSIIGIGEKTKITLLKKYKSIKKIKETPQESIIKLIGVAKAKKIISFLNSSK